MGAVKAGTAGGAGPRSIRRGSAQGGAGVTAQHCSPPPRQAALFRKLCVPEASVAPWKFLLRKSGSRCFHCLLAQQPLVFNLVPRGGLVPGGAPLCKSTLPHP